MFSDWPFLLGKGEQMAAAIGDLVGSTWSAIDASCDAVTAGDGNPFFSPRGQSGSGPGMLAMDTVSLQAVCLFACDPWICSDRLLVFAVQLVR